MTEKETTITPLFVSPLMTVQLDLDLEKLTEFAFEMQNKDKKGVQLTNKGGWQSNDINEEKHEEFIKLKKIITQQLQPYQSEVFGGMVFKEKIQPILNPVWVNINEKHHYNDWHIHTYCTLSGVYYIKHDGSSENGDIIFKHPKDLYMGESHWPSGLVIKNNVATAGLIKITPKSNMLFIFPSWVEHKVETNLKDDTRISLSFNVDLIS